MLPEKTQYRIDERMEIIGTEGALSIQENSASFTVCDPKGWRAPDTTYWPLIGHYRGGALRDEFIYFANCMREGKKPEIITPEDAPRQLRHAVPPRSHQNSAQWCISSSFPHVEATVTRTTPEHKLLYTHCRER